MINPHYDIHTVIDDKTKTIVCAVDFVGPDYLDPGIEDVRQTIVRLVIDTKEQQIREALIHLGWTPPKEN